MCNAEKSCINSCEIFNQSSVRQTLEYYRQQDEPEYAKIVFYIKAKLGDSHFKMLSELFFKATSKEQLTTINDDDFDGLTYTFCKGDTVCIWIYEPKGMFHIICNDLIVACDQFTHYLFPDRDEFEANVEDITFKGEWTQDEHLLQLFVNTVEVFMRKKYESKKHSAIIPPPFSPQSSFNPHA